MNVFAEVHIRSNRGTAHLVDVLRRFCTDQAGWVFNEEKSATYSANLGGGAGCVILSEEDRRNPAIALCEERNGIYRIANIVPKTVGSIPTDEYNLIAHQFHDAIKKWSRKNKAGLRLTISNTDLELEDIITAKIPLKLFRSFLLNHPLSYHPNDISRLDRFICGTSRFSRKPIEWEYLGEYLREKKEWPEENVKWCLERIRIGIEIIGEYKKFH